MFNSDADYGETAGSGARAPVSCAASDLKTILNGIADQIAATDTRLTRSMAEMHQRLDHFRHEPSSPARDHAPPAASAAYDRVEQRIQDLAARLASGSAPRDERPAPAPILSGAANPTFGPRLETHADTFDLVGSEPAGEPDGPWDRQAAEALVGVYTPQVPDGSEDKVAIASPVLIQIEDRFADVAARIEQYVRDLRPMEQFGQIEERFERLEQKLETVFGGAAQAAGAESLQNLEIQIDDMARQIEAAQHHFARLDGIEAEIRELADRVAEDRLAEVFRRHAPEQPDVADLAAMITDHITSTLGRASQTGSTEQLDELRGLIQSFAEESRHGDEQTATILDTMQQAMIRLLDRMDALETGQYPDESLYQAPQAVPPAPREPAPAPRGLNETERLAAAFDADAQPPLHYAPAPFAGQPPVEQSRAQDPRHAEIAAAVQAHQASQSPQPGPATAAAPQPPAATEPSDPIARARKNLIESARRARETADAAAPEKGAADGKMRLRVDAATLAAGRPASAAKASARGGIKASPLSMALVALVALGAGFTAVSMYHGRGTASQPAANVPLVKQSDAKPANAESGLEKDTSDAVVRPFEQQRRAAFEPQQDFGRVIDPMDQQSAPARQPSAASDSFTTAALTSGIAPGQGRVIQAPSLTEAALPPPTIGPNSLRLAAAQGDASAQFEVGSRLAEGKGVQQDFAAAISWYEKAAAQGFVLAQYRLGTHYERGLGVKADTDRAMDWYRKAAEQGNIKSMYNLAVLSTARQTPGPDYAGAVTWFSQAAAYGLVDSQFNLAVLYDSGVGVTRDAKAAYKWFSIAAAAGDADSVKRRDVIKAKLSKEQLRAVDAEIATWRPLAADPTGNDPRAAGELWKRRAGGQAAN